MTSPTSRCKVMSTIVTAGFAWPVLDYGGGAAAAAADDDDDDV